MKSTFKLHSSGVLSQPRLSPGQQPRGKTLFSRSYGFGYTPARFLDFLQVLHSIIIPGNPGLLFDFKYISGLVHSVSR